MSATRTRLEHDKMRLKYLSPMNRLNENRRRAMDYEEKMNLQMQNLIRERRHTLTLLAGSLDAHSPAKKLSGGYAFVSASSGKGLRSVHEVSEGSDVAIHLLDGEITAKVSRITEYGTGK